MPSPDLENTEMSTVDRAQHAERFRRLHDGPEILILPNAWDAVSAALMADAGAKAIATSSGAVSWSRGYADGGQLPLPVLLTAIRDIKRVIAVPLTVDIEGGYTEDMGELADNVARVVDAGAVGINFEDGTNSPDHHARKIEVVRKTAQRLNVDLFINARIDVYLHEITTGHSAFIETVRRSKMYHQAGADGIFVPEVSDHELVGQLAAKIALPLNIIGRAGAPAAAQLQALGVRRLSSAAILY